MDSGYFQIARIETLNREWQAALEAIDRSLIRNWHHHKARQLKVSILRHLNQKEEAITLCNKSLQLDQFNFSLYFEKFLLNNDEQALASALELCPDFCFPNQPEAVVTLQWAIKNNPTDHKALYYLGNFLYALKNYDEAVGCWEKSVVINSNFPTTHRNLSLAYFNKQNNAEKALASLKTAFELDQSDARVLMELDQLYKRLNYAPKARLKQLEKYRTLCHERDDLYLELVTLKKLSFPAFKIEARKR